MAVEISNIYPNEQAMLLREDTVSPASPGETGF